AVRLRLPSGAANAVQACLETAWRPLVAARPEVRSDDPAPLLEVLVAAGCFAAATLRGGSCRRTRCVADPGSQATADQRRADRDVPERRDRLQRRACCGYGVDGPRTNPDVYGRLQRALIR